MREQIEVTRSEELRKLLDDEEQALRRTEALLHSRLEAMSDAFKKISVTVEGHTVPVLKCMELMMVLKSQRDQMIEFTKGFNIKDLGLGSLKSAREAIIEAFKNAIDTWGKTLDSITTLFSSIMIEDSLHGLFQSVWMTKSVTLRLVWNAKDQCFDRPENLEPDGELKSFISEASKRFTSAPNGTVFYVSATQQGEGQVVFNSRIEPPPGYGVYYSNG